MRFKKKSCFFFIYFWWRKILLEKLFESTRTCVQKSNGYGRGINFTSKRTRMNYKPLSTCFGIAFVFYYHCFSRFYWTMALCAILPNFDFFEISKSRPDKNITVSKKFSQQNYELLKFPMQKLWVKNLLWIKSYSFLNSFIFKNVKLTMSHPVPLWKRKLFEYNEIISRVTALIIQKFPIQWEKNEQNPISKLQQ